MLEVDSVVVEVVGSEKSEILHKLSETRTWNIECALVVFRESLIESSQTIENGGTKVCSNI